MLPEMDALVEIFRLQLEREKLKLQRKFLHKRKHQVPAQVAPKPKRAYRPQNKAHRTYDGYRASMIEYETAVREVVGKDGAVTHAAIYADAGGPSEKTQRREMALYGLHYDRDWPPRTWPRVSPSSRNGTN